MHDMGDGADKADMGDEVLVDGLQDIYRGITRRGSRRLRPTDRLVEDLEIDSVASLELLVAVEDRFGVQLFDDPRAQDVRTVGELAALVRRCRDEAGIAGGDEVAAS